MIAYTKRIGVMAKRKQLTETITPPPTGDWYTTSTGQPEDAFGLENVLQLRDAVEQVVYGDVHPDKSHEPERAHTVEVLTTLGQMGELTEMDLDEAKKDYL